MRISLVSYINTRPFLDGLEQYFGPDEVSLSLLPPSACARSLHAGECDLALIPIGSIPDFSRLEILPRYCIGADGAVDSVFIFSQQPLEYLNTLVLDRHSRSSNGLARILLQHHWKRPLHLVELQDAPFDHIQRFTGAVVIGDEAIRRRGQFVYAYDLAEAWKRFSGLPFPFAVWACRPGGLTRSQRTKFQQAVQWGVNQRASSAKKWAHDFEMSPEYAQQYLTQSIDYQFDRGKHKALTLYQKLLAGLDEPVLA